MAQTDTKPPRGGGAPATRIAIVVPCYNEEQALPLTVPRLTAIIDQMGAMGLCDPAASFVMLCDDGSRDATWDVIRRLHQADGRVKGLSLAHNRGHQYVLLAGLMEVQPHCDAAVSLDADLQDDPGAIVRMVESFHRGHEVVLGVRSSRSTDSWFKRATAHAFYGFQQRMGLETVYDHADYRLLSARALELLGQYGEANLFLRGIIPQIGLSTDRVAYRRAPRCAGQSKYPLGKMLALSVDGITSFSSRPLRWIFFTGLLMFLAALAASLYVLLSCIFCDHVSPGWASLMLSVWLLGSLVLVALGIIGEYVGKIFIEVKHRPRYALREKLW